MKGFPEKVDGPLGPWYKKVNAAFAQIQYGDSKERLLEVLGEPDLIWTGDDLDGECDECLVYFDPYRKQVFAVDIKKRKVVSTGKGSREPQWEAQARSRKQMVDIDTSKTISLGMDRVGYIFKGIVLLMIGAGLAAAMYYVLRAALA